MQKYHNMEKSELHVTAGLAYLDLREEEIESLGKAVEQMLRYFSKMSEVDVSNLPPTTHALLKKNRVRLDAEAPEPDIDALLENAPELEDRLIVIPNVL